MLQHLNEASEQAAPRSGSSHGLRRQDTLLGDPLRRPRWGVPVRFHIQQVCVIGAQLWLFDLLTTDRRWRLVEPKDIRMEVASLAFSWETLAKRDLRRDGHGDGVKGVYLGELVWVLIAQLLPKVLESSKRNLMKTALFAVGFGAWDASVIMSAKALEVALDTKYCLANVMPCLPSSLPRQPSLNQCFVHIHLICGRGLVRQHDQYCNVLVRLELKNPETPQGQVTDLALAPLRMWTKSPWWDQKFCLGPAKCTSSLIRIRCFHCKARHVMSTKCDGLLGQVMVPLSEILAERSRTKDGSIVRWFPLDAASMMIPRHGHLKLGFQLSGQAHLSKRGRAMNVRTNSCVNPSVQIPDFDTSWLETLTEASVVHVSEDISKVRNALRKALRKEEWDSFDCIFQQFPHQVNVCRDDRYVGRFGKGAQCDPEPNQVLETDAMYRLQCTACFRKASCGFQGFTCCMSFWGHSEKLEIFTGARWDLPCNCGLGDSCVKTREHKFDRDDQQYERHCCANSLAPKPQESCMLVPEQQPMTIYGDSHFYSSYLLNDFIDGRIDPTRAMERCRHHRAGTLLDSDPARVGAL
eukprot:symbB.v1.2.024893.t1/scaffold2388.1/size114014/10